MDRTVPRETEDPAGRSDLWSHQHSEAEYLDADPAGHLRRHRELVLPVPEIRQSQEGAGLHQPRQENGRDGHRADRDPLRDRVHRCFADQSAEQCARCGALRRSRRTWRADRSPAGDLPAGERHQRTCGEIHPELVHQRCEADSGRTSGSDRDRRDRKLREDECEVLLGDFVKKPLQRPGHPRKLQHTDGHRHHGPADAEALARGVRLRDGRALQGRDQGSLRHRRAGSRHYHRDRAAAPGDVPRHGDDRGHQVRAGRCASGRRDAVPERG